IKLKLKILRSSLKKLVHQWSSSNPDLILVTISTQGWTVNSLPSLFVLRNLSFAGFAGRAQRDFMI
ncbi:hypothetical protein OAD96_02495, partial [Pseudomonadales bacterium]|nr:hypothetical protein [Pseudomonadales bacterium]